ncbi:MAG: hypothetical protein O7D30_01895 [Rickettsia endosymbiont of Ixodes persulcatus]|nr:hypothetical protein [Rickettsia endosymbiont of Ixodes persulcatus]
MCDLKATGDVHLPREKTFISYYLQPEYETIDNRFGVKTAKAMHRNERNGGRRRNQKNHVLENGSDLRCFPSREGLQTRV